LHCASSQGRLDIVSLLLDRGAGINTQDKVLTPFPSFHFFELRTESHLSTSPRLLRSVTCTSSSLNPTRHLSLGNFSVKRMIATLVLSLCYWTEGPTSISQTRSLVLSSDFPPTALIIFENGTTPLHRAASGGHLGIVSLLTDRGAQVNLQDKVIFLFFLQTSLSCGGVEW
jgi:hypothetical protein